jgi:O-antigen ligase
VAPVLRDLRLYGVFIVLGALLSVEYWRIAPTSSPFWNKWRAEVIELFASNGTQWVWMAFLMLYAAGFVWLRWRLLHGCARELCNSNSRRTEVLIPEAILFLFATILLITYSLAYNETARLTDALVGMGCIALAQGAAFWEKLRQRKGNPSEIRRIVVLSILLLLLFASLWQPESFYIFEYRGVERSSGMWSNPNRYGLLMGVGLVLATGCFQSVRYGVQEPKSGGSHLMCLWRKLVPVFYIAAAACLGLGLVQSYSRGAWVGVGLAAMYLGAVWWTNRPARRPGEVTGRTSLVGFETLLQRNAHWLLIGAIGVMSVTFWESRHTEQRLVRRVFSIGNVNDFSWRNRVVTYEGALQMMAEKPWLGFGWNQPSRQYKAFYQPSNLSEGASLSLNDYFLLGMTLGIPALALFLAYIWLAFCPLRPRPPSILDVQSSVSECFWIMAACRAAVIVLLVGFWFNGGLFKLALATPFWILLELGRSDSVTVTVRAGGVERGGS